MNNLETYTAKLTGIIPLLKFPVKKDFAAYLLNPGKLIADLIDSGVNYQKAEITHWDLFEWGTKDQSDIDLLHLLYKDVGNEQMILITDEGLTDKVGFILPAKLSFYNFVACYEMHYQMEVFQPQDYIAFFPAVGGIHVIHHEGFLFSFFF